LSLVTLIKIVVMEECVLGINSVYNFV